MVNYKNACVYKLCCKDTSIKDVYIGSTCSFRSRKYQHKSACNNEKDKSYNHHVYKFIKDHGGFENWDMVLIEEVDCEDKQTLHKIERSYIEKLGATLNKIIPTRTNKEYKEDNKEKIKLKDKEYREKNKEKIKEYNENNKEKYKKYRENNKEKIKEYSKEYYEKNKEKKKEKRKLRTICMCGTDINYSDRKRHIKTGKHKNLMKIFIKKFKKE